MQRLRWTALAALLAMAPCPAAAQTDAGRISGTVRDQSNAWVPETTITVTNERTGEARTVATNGQGYFIIGPLKPSSYTIKTNKSGFAPIEYTQMPLAVGQELALDFEIKPAGLAEEVTVVGTAPALDISSARMGANVSEREVQGLPVNGRQMSQLMLQAPGSQNAGTGTWQEIRFSGRAVEQNVIRYDGIEASAIIDSAPGNLNGEIATAFRLQASLENVQEFRVESSSYPAEYGTGTGGQVSVITKSGGNSLRGTIFEFIRDDGLDAPNYFDKAAGLPKSKLDQNQYGGSLGGPIAKNRAFFFASYESYRLDAGVNAIEAVPSDAAWARASAAVLPLRPAFLGPGAVILPGKSSNADFDIAQLQALSRVREDAFSARVDVRLNDRWSAYLRFSHDQGTSDTPEGVTGRVVHITDNPTNAVFNVQGVLSNRTINELKVGYNAAPTRINGVAPNVPGIDLSNISVTLTGNIANAGIAGQGGTTGVAAPGGLVRANSATNGRGQPYDPYSLTVADSLSRLMGTHYLKAGGEFRAIRMSTDRLGGTTYTFGNVTGFLNNTPTTVAFNGDVSDPSPFNNGATGERHIEQEYYVAFAQDEWRARPNLTINYGLRYDYYAPLRERDDLLVKFNIDTGVIDPNTTPLYKSSKNNFQPRISATFSPTSKTVVRGGFGIFVGPGQTEDQIQPIESDRIASTISSGALLAYPIDTALIRSNFANSPNTRSYQPRAFANDYTLPERIYQYTGSMQQELPHNLVATVAYVGSQGRNLFLRSVANQIVRLIQTSPTSSAVAVREFSIVQPDGVTVQNPYAEIDFKTSGGQDSYNALQLSLTRRMTRGLTMNAQYTLGKSWGNTAGSNEATTAGNNARTLEEFDYDIGYNNFDVRHTFNLSALYELPFGRGRAFMSDASGLKQVLLGGWDVGGIVNARSGVPVQVFVTRPDIVYMDGSGNVFTSAAADRTAVINTPGGGATRAFRRPDLVPGVDPFTHSDGLLFLNPAAFAIPKPGTFGNLTRNSLHGPSFRQVDLVIAKRFDVVARQTFEFRMEMFNILNTTNFANPVGVLPNALPSTSTTQANTVQPGQPYTTGAAQTFGTLTSTVNRTVGLGTNRQIQFGLRYSF